MRGMEDRNRHPNDRGGGWRRSALVAAVWAVVVGIVLYMPWNPLTVAVAGGLAGYGVHATRKQIARRRLGLATMAGDEIQAPSAIRLLGPSGSWGRWQHGYLIVQPSGHMAWRSRSGTESATLHSLNTQDGRRPTIREALSIDPALSVITGDSTQGPVELAVARYLLATLPARVPGS